MGSCLESLAATSAPASARHSAWGLAASLAPASARHAWAWALAEGDHHECGLPAFLAKASADVPAQGRGERLGAGLQADAEEVSACSGERSHAEQLHGHEEQLLAGLGLAWQALAAKAASSSQLGQKFNRTGYSKEFA